MAKKKDETLPVEGEELLPEINEEEEYKIPKPEIVKEEVEVLDDKTSKADKRRKERMFRIIINEQAGPDAHEDVFIGVNGRHFLIKRGHEVVVPEGIVNVLKEAITTHIIKHEDGREELRHVPRISFNILGEEK